MLATGAWAGSGVVLYVLAPMAAPAIVLLGVVAPIGWLLATKGSLSLQRPSASIFALLLGTIYLAINASWSLSPADARSALIMLVLLIAVLHVLDNVLAASCSALLRALCIALIIGTVLSGLALFLDAFSMQWPRRRLMSIMPALRPDPREMLVANGKVVYLEPFLLNRSTAALMFLFWPTLLAISILARSGRRWYLWLAGLVPAVAAVLVSEHATSQVALAGSAVVFAACSFLPRFGWRALIAVWVGAVLLVVPLAALAYKNQLYLSPWLAHSAQHRIVIWGYTSGLVGDAPIFGAGLNTARALNDPERRPGPVAPGSAFQLTTSLHSHNAYLQAWYETGALGAALLMTVGLAAIGAIARVPLEARAYLYAAFAACALLGSTSYSLWQPWFMASFGLAASCAMVGRSLAARSISASSGLQPSSRAAWPGPAPGSLPGRPAPAPTTNSG